MRLLTLILICSSFISARAGDDDWSTRERKLQSQIQKINHLDHSIHELIEEKKHTEDQEKLKTIIHEMTTQHTQLAEVIKEYNQDREYIRFHFPEKTDAKSERKYPRFQIKSLEEMESGLGIDSRLDRVKMRMDEKFPSVRKRKKTVEKHKEEKAKPTPDPNADRPKLIK